ncbi:MAG: anti-sigma regulatory factor [Vulcanimicrobiaceae bacterium]
MARPKVAALRLNVTADPRRCRSVRERVARFIRSCGVPDGDTMEFVTAVSEAFANAVEHAHTLRPIEISCSLVGGTTLVASIADHGTGLSLERALRPADALPDDLCERGRGMPIMRRCCDTFSLRTTPGGGTTVVLGRTLRHVDKDEPIAS